MQAASVEGLFEIYARRVRSQGERGILSFLSQRLWLQDQELTEFLQSHGAGTVAIETPGRIRYNGRNRVKVAGSQSE